MDRYSIALGKRKETKNFSERLLEIFNEEFERFRGDPFIRIQESNEILKEIVKQLETEGRLNKPVDYNKINVNFSSPEDIFKKQYFKLNEYTKDLLQGVQ